jgi:ABC-type branched-subunit amino acid transport system ATPase component
MGTLIIENVVAGYGSGPNILKGLSLTVETCKTYCIIGPNGAGKSTLLKVVAGLLKPREGKVVFKGETLNSLRPDQVLRLGLCYIPSDRSLFPDMTVKENLRMGGYVLRDTRLVEQRIEEIFTLFPVLREKSSQNAKTLSGGQQQLTAIARSMVLKPELIMLDEPSLGLAPKVVQQIFGTVKMLRDQGLTIVLVEQNARKGLEIADQGVVLDLGTNSFERPAAEVLQDPRIQELYLGRRKAAHPVEERQL